MITLRPPGDKSISHRAALIAPLAREDSLIRGLSSGEDVRSTISAMGGLGAQMTCEPEPEREGFTLRVRGGQRLRSATETLDCGNSGTTARLLAGIMAGTGLEGVLDGDDSLRARPMARVVYPLQAMGSRIEYLGEPESLPLRFHGRSTGSLRTLRHRGRVASAQVKSAVLLAGLTGRVRVEIHEPAASRDHTERMLAELGVPVEFDPGRAGPGEVRLDPERWDGRLRGLQFEVPGDPSSAAFLIGAALLARRSLRIENVLANPGRIGFLDVLLAMGASIQREPHADRCGEPVETWTVHPPDRLGPFDISGDRIPAVIDELPLLVALASRAAGRSEIRDAAELRVKESDRIMGMASNLAELGVEVEERADGLSVQGSDGRLSGSVITHGDHRVAMAFGALGAAPDVDVTVDDRECAAVSYPEFWDVMERLASSRDPGARSARSTVQGADLAVQQAVLARSWVRGRVIAIDGPAASGKSTTARKVAERLGFQHVNSGLFYRAITWWAVRESLDETSAEFAARIGELELELVPTASGLTVSIDGALPEAALHGPEVAGRVSSVAAIPAVRIMVLARLREAARRFSLVCDGRDIGTTVFPTAKLKVFLVAAPEERARRRLFETKSRLTEETVREEAERLTARDEADATRAVSPLRKAVDAIEIDTTDLGADAVVAAVVSLAHDRGLTGHRDERTEPEIG